MKKIFSILCVVFAACIGWAAGTNIASIQFEVWGRQTYRVDTKTNLTDKWYPYSVIAMCQNCIGTNATNGAFIYGPEVTADQHQSCTIDIPAPKQQAFFRLYTLPENTNGVVWPTSNSVSVPFKLIPPL